MKFHLVLVSIQCADCFCLDRVGRNIIKSNLRALVAVLIILSDCLL